MDKGLSCSCGFFTSHPDYMLTHVAEGNCTISEQQASLIRQRLQGIYLENRKARQTLAYLESEEKHLTLILQMQVVKKRPALRACVWCGKKTLDRFRGRPQCAKHVGDSDIAKILEEAFDGPEA